MLIDNKLSDVLDAFASSDPTPGGGSASALAGSIGASLLIMASGLPKTRNNSNEDRAILDRASTALRRLRASLIDLIDSDADAYERVVGAYRLPKGTDEEKNARSDAIQEALRGAIDTPLQMMRDCAAALRQAEIVAERSNPSAESDVGVARELLRAGLTGARLNVEINLGTLKDAQLAESIREEVRQLTVSTA